MAILSNFQTDGEDVVKVAPPTQSGTLTYNGNEQSPSWTEYPTGVITITSTPQINAGTYTATATLVSGYVWADTLKSAPRDLSWTINRVAGGTITLSKSSVELGKGESDTVTVTLTNSGDTVHAMSTNTSIARVSVSGKTITITDGGTEGTATITISASGNYAYNTNKTISVNVSYGPEIVTWASGTDAQVKAMVDAADAGSINLTDYWNVGDKRTVSLSAMAATGVGESHRAQNVVMVLTAKDTKTAATSNPCYNYTYVTATSGRTYPSFIVQQENCLSSTDSGTTSDSERGYMNSSNTNSGGWNGCARRTWCNSVYRNAIPSTLRSIFKQVKVKAMNGGNQSGVSLVTSDDYFFLPAEREIFDSNDRSNATEWAALAQWPHYSTSSNRVKKMGISGAAYAWWGRSARRGNATNFCNVDSDGSGGGSGASNTNGLAPAGCI